MARRGSFSYEILTETLWPIGGMVCILCGWVRFGLDSGRLTNGLSSERTGEE